MSQEIDPKQQDKIEGAKKNFEETLRRIEPYIRKPVEDPKPFHSWTKSDSGRIQSNPIDSKIIHTQNRT